jgi:hypothetical protein
MVDLVFETLGGESVDRSWPFRSLVGATAAARAESIAEPTCKECFLHRRAEWRTAGSTGLTLPFPGNCEPLSRLS